MSPAFFLFLALPVFGQVEPQQFRTGDDIRWADPGYDDGGWSGPKDTRHDRRHAWSWARYRVCVPERIVDPVIGVESAAMEVYVDGRLIGRHGQLPPQFVDSTRGYSTFPLPPEVAAPGQLVTVALRMWDPPGARLHPARHNPPKLLIHPSGETTVHAQRAAADLRGYLLSACLALVVLLLVAVAGREQQRGPLFLVALTSWVGFAIYEMAHVACYWLPWSRVVYLAAGVVGGLLVLILLEAIALLVERKPPWWMRVGQAFFFLVQISVLSVHARFETTRWIGPAEAMFLIAGFAPPFIAIGLQTGRVLRWRGTRSLILLLALSLGGNAYARLAHAKGWPSQVKVASVELPVNTLVFSFFGIAMTGVILSRFRQAARFASQLQGELDAARNMQELLLLGTAPATPGYSIDTAYIPAHEVGGDFFRILPAESEGTLIVVGDVSGKGLRAAMTVSVIVGALLNRRSNRPAALLEELNRAIMGQLDGGFVTCCAVLLEPGRRVTISSAGHPAPYFQGAEVNLPEGLPLGIAEVAQYREAEFQMKVLDQMALLSDGVLEAANGRGELFGFERTRGVSDKAASEIAEAAMEWGQMDDITVVTVAIAIV